MEEPRVRFRFDSFTFVAGFGIGTFLGVALALLAIALVQRPAPSNQAQPQQEVIFVPSTPTPGGPTVTPDARARTRTAAEVYLGPGDAYAIIGTLARGEAVEIMGRDSSSEWVAVRFPPGSSARGWLQAAGLDNLSEVERLTVVAPTPIPRNVPAPPPVFSSGGGSPGSGGGGRPLLTDEPSVITPTPAGPALPPDLVVTRVALQLDGTVLVTIGNRGLGPLVGQAASVLVRDRSSNQELISAGTRGLVVGESIQLTTRVFRVNGEAEITALVDPYGAVADADRSNNSMSVVLSNAEPTPTPTPRRRDE
jgi:hypothetical protein